MKILFGGLITTVIGGLIVTYLKEIIAYLLNIISYLYPYWKWFYDNVMLFDINLWLLLLILFIAYKFKQHLLQKSKLTDLDKKVKSLIEIFNDFDNDKRNVFYYVMYCQDKNIECTLNLMLKHMTSKFHLGTLETTHSLDKLIEDNILEPHYNMIHPTKYTLSKKGRSIAVELIKNSKQSEKIK